MTDHLHNISIEGISYFLPSNSEDISSLSIDYPEWDIDKIISKTGIRKRYYVDQDETAVDLAVKACEKFFSEFDVKKSEIDAIVFVTQSPDYVLPTSACLIQERVNLPKRSLGFDLNLGCSGFVNTLSVAASLINSDIVSNCLIICAETYSKYIVSDDRTNRPIFSDGAAVCLLRKGGDFKIGPFEFGINGSGSQNLIVKGSGARKLAIGETEGLFMNGGQILLFTLDEIPKTVNKLLEKEKIEINDLSLVIFHQASKLVLDGLTKKLGISPEKVFSNLEYLGNTVSCTIPIALCDAFDQGLIKPGNKILIVGFGVGYSWGATIIKWGSA
jgi:3-oxoacyl-[acyl-carrier-protein] synthase III